MVQQQAGRVQQGIAGAQGLVPLATVPLFEGGSFDATYNNRSAMAVAVPSGAVRAVIMAVISGHGSDDNNWPGAAAREYEALPGRTLLVFSYELADPASRVMLADPWSVQSFLRLAPFRTHFMFAPTSPNATEAQSCAEQLRASLTRAMLAAGLPEEVQRAR
ncbi:N-glycanase_N domain-containing protein [Haematococcus lacustris]|uniref:N-glycanase_N domain-containing protein n=1 Tax=Haematococcus lacustris TaxID=44745 RepID=A0A6A0A2B9_HAELA|nr:N-glycanase_N domain-containing protein [Haematococcus lacustris]